MATVPNLAIAVVVVALVPAVCEEFAFRGFILSGLERQHRTRSAILLSALMFGFLHVLLSLFQQLFNAALLGIVLGLLAVRSKSIIPCLLFHFLNNAMAVSLSTLVNSSSVKPIVGWIYRSPSEGLYHWVWIVVSVLTSGLLLFHLWHLKFERAGREPDDVFSDGSCRSIRGSLRALIVGATLQRVMETPSVNRSNPFIASPSTAFDTLVGDAR